VSHEPRSPQALRWVLDTTNAVLLDFDGPVCSVFAGVPAHAVADELRASLVAAGAELPCETTDTGDPMVVLRRTVEQAPDLAAAAEQFLAAAEVTAIRQAAPTLGARELLRLCRAVGRPVAIVSNNTVDAIRLHLADQDLLSHVTTIIGRDPHDVTHMKPHPYLITTALNALGSAAAKAVMVGDAVTDIEAARAAGTPVIGYANKPHKLSALAHADAIITDMHAIARALTT
jgi:HAD superfamily hydrolase (TIGR01509 family)